MAINPEFPLTDPDKWFEGMEVDHDTHTHKLYDIGPDGGPKEPAEEFGEYKSPKDAGRAIGKIVRKAIWALDPILYADNMHFDNDMMFGFKTSAENGPLVLDDFAKLQDFKSRVGDIYVGRLMELMLRTDTLQHTSFALRWYDGYTLADMTSAVSWASDRSIGNWSTEAQGQGFNEIQEWLERCYAVYVTPLLPEGEDSEEGFGGQMCAVVLSEGMWDAIDLLYSLGDNNMEWTQGTFDGVTRPALPVLPDGEPPF